METTKKQFHKSKWRTIVDNFLNSENPMIKIYEPYATESAAYGISHYLSEKELPVHYAKRGKYLYIFRTDYYCITMEDAINGKY